MSNSHFKRGSGGFTLVELMIVMTVILVLMTLTIAIGPLIMRQVHILTTKTKIDVLIQQIMKYEKDYGVYPADSQWIGNQVDNTRFLAAMQAYGVKESDVTDAFGNPIIYDRVWSEGSPTQPTQLEINMDFPSDPRQKDPQYQYVKDLDEERLDRVHFFMWSTGPDPSAARWTDDIMKQG